jgi:hypothetical protein
MHAASQAVAVPAASFLAAPDDMSRLVAACAALDLEVAAPCPACLSDP